MAKLAGKIVSVSTAGDAITDIAVADLTTIPHDDRVRIHCEGHMTAGIFPPDHSEPEMTFLAVAGASGFLELTLVGDSATKFLGIQPGHAVSLTWT